MESRNIQRNPKTQKIINELINEFILKSKLDPDSIKLKEKTHIVEELFNNKF